MSEYQAMDEYTGGGSILNGWTSVRNIVTECDVHRLSPDAIENVWRIVKAGGECIILDGQIMAADEAAEKAMTK